MPTHNDVTITTNGAKLTVRSPYNGVFVDRARDLGGKYEKSSRTWTFDARDEVRVRDLLVEVFGHDDKPPARVVTVRVDVHAYQLRVAKDYELVFAGRVWAYRQGRDYPVRLSEGAVVVAGRFPATGGSVRNPSLAPDPGLILEIRDVPAGHRDLLADGVTVMVEGELDAVASADGGAPQGKAALDDTGANAGDLAAARAERLLGHYLRTVWRKSGLTWNEDNDAEVGVIVDAIAEMIAAGIAGHADNAPHPYPDGSTS